MRNFPSRESLKGAFGYGNFHDTELFDHVLHVQFFSGNRAFAPTGPCDLPLLLLPIALSHESFELQFSCRHFVGQAYGLVEDPLLDGRSRLVQLIELISDLGNGSDGVILLALLVVFGQLRLCLGNIRKESWWYLLL